MESMWFRMPEPSNGAPSNSEDDFSLSGRVAFELPCPPPGPEGALNSELARTGDGPEMVRSREEFEDAYAAGFGEVVLRAWP